MNYNYIMRNYSSGNKKGFTLAELLITLGIIGVVSVLTIPVLMANVKDTYYKNAYKKAYSDLKQVYQHMIMDGVYESPCENPMYDSSGNKLPTSYSTSYRDLFIQMSKYFKSVKTCFDSNSICFLVYNTQTGGVYSSPPEYLSVGNGITQTGFIDASGRAWMMYSPNENVFMVDLNGDSAPNQLGKDRFPFAFLAKCGENEEISIDIFLNDASKKNRWCPSGKCFYKSWLE